MAAAYEQKLNKEREKLDRLIDQALADGTPIDMTQAIMNQCKKVNLMILERENKEVNNRSVPKMRSMFERVSKGQCPLA